MWYAPTVDGQPAGDLRERARLRLVQPADERGVGRRRHEADPTDQRFTHPMILPVWRGVSSCPHEGGRRTAGK